MASTEKIVPSLPETLPDDFSEWDSEQSSAVKPDSPREWPEAWESPGPFSATPEPPGRPVDRGPALASTVDELHVSRSAAATPSSVKQQRDFSEWDSEQSSAVKPENPPELTVSPGWWEAWAADHSIGEAPKPLNQPVEHEIVENIKREIAESIKLDEKQETGKKKWVTIAAVSVCSTALALLFMIPLFHHGMKPPAEQPVHPLLETSQTQMQPQPKPQAGQPFAQTEPPATAGEQQATGNQPAGEESTANPAQTPTAMQTQMMNEQLTAPTRISQAMKKQVAENAPPPLSLGMAAAGGMGGSRANVSVFNGQARPIVEAAPSKPAVVPPSKPILISSIYASGRLIHRTMPVYPRIAIQSGISGTVELRVTISKTGTIEDVKAVKGPDILRQAAVDAVRSWRYKPFTVDKQPAEVQTTVDVDFALGH